MKFTPTIENLVFSESPGNKPRHKHVTDARSGLSIFSSIEVINDGDAAKRLETHCFSILKKNLADAEEIEDNFEAALKEINAYIEEEGIGELNAILGVLDENVLYISQTGDAEAYLIRNASFNIISESTKGSRDKVFMNISSGELSKQDTVLCSVSRLLRFLTDTQILNIFRNTPASDRLNGIKDFGLSNEVESLGLMSISFDKQEQFAVAKSSDSKEAVGPSWMDSVSSFAENQFGNFKQWIDKLQHQKKLLSTGIVVVSVLLVVAIYFLNTKQIEERHMADIETTLSNVEQGLKKAENLNIQGKKTEASLLLDKLNEDINEVLNSGEFRKEAMQLSSEINDQKESVNNIMRITEPKVIADLGDKRQDAQALGILGIKNNTYAFETDALYEIILSVVESLNVGADTRILHGVSMVDKFHLYFYTEDKRVFQYDEKTRSFSFADTADPTWKDAVEMAVFKRYLYFLDPNSKQIWKYLRKNTSFSGASSYIKDKSVDISNAVSFAIDGSVYILHDNGDITQLYTGEKEDFRIENLPNYSLKGANKIYTDIDYQYIYVLNSNKNTVCIIKKGLGDDPARYIKQVAIENAEQIRDMYVKEDGLKQQIYLIGKSKVYLVNL